MSEIKINRLVLIGNGFDLAHGLKTSFFDFINYCAFEILRTIHQKVHNKDTYPNLMIEHNIINLSETHKILDRCLKFYRNTDSDEMKQKLNILKEFKSEPNFKYDKNTDYFKSPISFFDLINEGILKANDLKEKLSLYSTSNNAINIFNNKLFRLIFTNIIKGNNTKNWGGIEHDFYQTLLEVDKFYAQNSTRDGIDILNEEFQNIINCFTYYMESIASRQQPKFIPQILEHIKKTIQKRELNNKLEFLNQKPSLKDLATNTKLPLYYQVNETLFLNFNYTNTIVNYIQNDPSDIKEKHIQIHGKLNDKYNSIIFGYGDEKDSSYQELENKNDNRYLQYSKSLHYLLNSNYKDLLTFLEQDMYQVYIWGHSCATSDRVLLQTIFEHENCVSIKPFFYKSHDGTDNFTDLCTNISRSFTDKKKFRDVVVNKKYCEPL